MSTSTNTYVWSKEEILQGKWGVCSLGAGEGGRSGLGFETVKFIVQNRGGSVVFLSRQNPTSEQLKEMQLLESQNEGCRIISLQCNVRV